MQNKTIQILHLGLDFAKDMSPSDWIRAPFLILAAVLKFLIRNLANIGIIIATLILIFYSFKFFRWWKRERELPDVTSEEKFLKTVEDNEE